MVAVPFDYIVSQYSILVDLLKKNFNFIKSTIYHDHSNFTITIIVATFIVIIAAVTINFA